MPARYTESRNSSIELPNENMDVYKFYSGEDAFVCIRSMDFDLAVLDIMLPDVSRLSKYNGA